MVSNMEERGHISPTDISPLLEALLDRNYHGIAGSVKRSFEEAMATPTVHTGRHVPTIY